MRSIPIGVRFDCVGCSDEQFCESFNFDLVSCSPLPRARLTEVAKKLGMRAEDDVFVFERSAPVPEWQADEIVSFDARLGGQEVYEGDDVLTQWDTLKGTYLLASLPESCVDPCVQLVERTCAALGLTLELDGRPVSASSLEREMRQCISWVMKQHSVATGSAELEILIEQTYPRG